MSQPRRPLAERAKLLEVITKQDDSTLFRLSAQRPYRLKLSAPRIKCTRLPRGVMYEILYVLKATGHSLPYRKQPKPFWRLKCTLVAIYSIAEPDATDEELKSFLLEVCRDVHPYFSEHVTRRSRDHGIPGLVLEPFRPSEALV